MPAQSVHCLRKLSLSPDTVWQALGSFDNAWHPSVTRCDFLRSPTGALLRNFEDAEGRIYEEQRTYLSDTDRVLCYRMVHGIEGAQSYSARVEVTPAQGGALVTWHADIIAAADRLEDICAGTKDIFEAGLDALSTSPTYRPVNRIPLGDPVNTLESAILDGTPRLGLLQAATPTDRPGTLILFLHGIGGHASNWTPQLQALAGQYNVAALNLRGYGDSTLGFGPSQIEDYCEDILSVMRSQGAEKLVLAGLSYGSWIATSFAMKHGDRLAGLILAGGCTGMSEADPRERENFRISREVPLDAGQSPADFAPNVVDLISGPNADEAQRQEMLTSMSAIPSTTYRDALNCFCNPPEKFDFAKISCPVLMMTGEFDRLAPPGEIAKVSERILAATPLADVQFEVISGAGHICNLEAPVQVNALLHRFLSRLPGVSNDYKSTTLEKQREKRERIRQAAHDEFCENGFDGTSMDRIATRAEVSKPTLYQYFGDKNGLLEAVLDVGRMAIVAPLSERDGSLVDRLWRFSWVYAEFVLRSDMLSLARLILGEAQRKSESAIAYHQNGPGRALEGLVEFVQAAAAAGEISIDEADLAAQDLWSLILSGPRDRCLHYVDHRPEEAELLRSIGHGLRVFLKAYATEPKKEIAALNALILSKETALEQKGRGT